MENVSNNEIAFSKHIFYFVKRFFDVIVGILGIFALIPLILIVKIISIINGDHDSIFYSQERIGKNGKIFKLYKFRSMVPNADIELKKLLRKKKYREEWEKNQKLLNDPRITKVGKFLRKTSLDEVPQFINILKGDMSLIGPRPLIKGELEQHNGNDLIYYKMRPGITGWWACNGRSEIDYDERLELEYYYVNNCSIILDIKCILKTVKAVIKKDGAK